jgi:hypothetical protein
MRNNETKKEAKRAHPIPASSSATTNAVIVHAAALEMGYHTLTGILDEGTGTQ